jgi:SAM-dependent methyltransferase
MLHLIKKKLKRFIWNKYLYFLIRNKRPISNLYGLDRGEAIDRYYIEDFLENNKAHVKGACLELLNNNYTTRYGEGRISKSSILDINKKNKTANIYGDLKDLSTIISDNTYDCIILTQVLQFIDNYQLAISECYRILKPGGTLLITVPALSRIDCQTGTSGDYWRFTSASINYILKQNFNNYQIKSYGNVKTCLSFLTGLSQEDLNKNDFIYNDDNFPCIITARAIKNE